MTEQFPSPNNVNPNAPQPGQFDAAMQEQMGQWDTLVQPPSNETYNGLPAEEVGAMGQLATAGEVEVQAHGEQATFAGPSTEAHAEKFVEKTVDGFTFKTNLPEGVWPFEPTKTGETPKHPYSRSILPSVVDSLPVGDFRVSHPDGYEDYDRKVIVTEDADGKYINRVGDMGLIKNYGHTEGLVTALGFKFDRSGYIPQPEAVPSPATLQKNAAELGVDIKFFADQKLIAGKDYLETFVEDKFPISTASAEYYLHDSRDDHLTAVVLGGEPLKKALHDSAQQALETGLDADVRAAGIDDFTAYLRGTVSPTMNNHNELNPYGFNTLLASGKSIGLDETAVRGIYDAARENASKWGMKLNPEPVSLQKVA
jgi:hypothetical protein